MMRILLLTCILWVSVLSSVGARAEYRSVKSSTAAGSLVKSAPQTQRQCKAIRTRRHAKISKPPNISGSWFSPSCELLPGPQYILRHYQFSKSAKEFIMTRYYYADEYCREVAYGIRAEGVISAQSPSWYHTLTEATYMDIQLTKLSIKPYKPDVSMILAGIIRAGCEGFRDAGDIWRYLPSQSLQLNASDHICMESLSFSVNELLAMRQVDYYKKRSSDLSDKAITRSATIKEVKSRHRKRRKSLNLTERELELGGRVWFSQTRTPTSYQPPLYSYTHKHCEACDCIHKADIDNPPVRCHIEAHLPTSPPANLTGHWFSHTCESVPTSQFTLRSFKFNEGDATFDITTHYFTDAFCTKPSYVLRATGQLLAGQKHSRIHNTRTYQFLFNSLSVGVLSETMAKLMNMGNVSRCGHITDWKLGDMHDVIGTGGCDTLELVIRDSQFVLIKSEANAQQSHYIIMSDMKSNQSVFETQVTDFTPKLKKCDSAPKTWMKLKTQKLTQSSSGGIIISHSVYLFIMYMVTGVVCST